MNGGRYLHDLLRPAIRDRVHLNGLAPVKVLAAVTEFSRSEWSILYSPPAKGNVAWSMDRMSVEDHTAKQDEVKEAPRPISAMLLEEVPSRSFPQSRHTLSEFAE